MSNIRYRNTYIDGCSHFCTASIYGFLPLLDDDEARRIVITSWNSQRRRYGVGIEGFVIMPEHVHLEIRGSGDGVRKFMQYSLSQSSRMIQALLQARSSVGDAKAKALLEAVRRVSNGASQGKVWKERFRAVALDSDAAVLVKLDYIHHNPVRRGLVENAVDWKWSSCRNYEGDGGVMSVDLP
jgi:putative transposase